MAKKDIIVDVDPSEARLNRIHKSTNIVFNIIFIILATMCIVPVLFVFIISISSQESIRANGYRFIPDSLSLEAYKFIFREKADMIRAVGVSVFVTAVGSTIGVALTTMMGYVISRRNYRFNRFFSVLVFIPMIFNGGMVSSYVINTQLLHLQNSIWALIWPLAVSSFYIIICKTFFKTNIPDAIIESAQIDGASQFTIFSKIALPLSKPILATIGLFLAFGYWNDWFQSSLYITNSNLFSLQALLDHAQKNIAMLANNPTIGLTMSEYVNSIPKDSARMAMAIIIVVPIACTYPFFQKYFINGMTIGSVKE